MSRIGRKPISIPAGVEAVIDGLKVEISGPKGKLDFVHPSSVMVEFSDGVLNISPTDNARQTRAMWGTTRACLQNMVTGVTDGFQKRLLIEGVGYRATMSGTSLKVTLGYSHDIDFPVPEGIEIKAISNTEILISGIDRQRVGQTTANIRKLRPPEPYKGKGIRRSDEFVVRKEGKKK